MPAMHSNRQQVLQHIMFAGLHRRQVTVLDTHGGIAGMEGLVQLLFFSYFPYILSLCECLTLSLCAEQCYICLWLQATHLRQGVLLVI